jgi:hypothetical protein
LNISGFAAPKVLCFAPSALAWIISGFAAPKVLCFAPSALAWISVPT